MRLLFQINSSLLEATFDKKQHSSLLETKKSCSRLHNSGSLLDDLKELNLGTNKEPRYIYVRSSLTPKEEIIILNSLAMFSPRVGA